jgi:glycosyltransferase involved in cell wall biosynthesis
MGIAIVVTHFIPSPVGHGGHHRTYQIVHDLESVLPRRVVVVSLPEWRQSRPAGAPTPNPLMRFARRLQRRLMRYAENPYKLLAHTPYTPSIYRDPEFANYYKELIQQIPKPAVCIIEHTGFADVIKINAQYGIPTVCCIQNLEAFDLGVLDHNDRWQIYARTVDFANEFRVLAQCAERLFISRVEAGLISGLGLSSHYYPYVPVGAIRQHLEVIRQERSKGQIKSGLFLMLGSAGHSTTKESFAWFIQNAQKYGLPKGVRVVVCGSQTDKLLPAGDQVPGLELRGWLEQDVLEQLLVQAKAVLVPQRFGFGAITRLPEMACAGVPVIASRHSVYAIDPTPGLYTVDDSWDAWYTTMEQLAKDKVSLPAIDYSAWEERQPKTLQTVVKALLVGSCHK